MFKVYPIGYSRNGALVETLMKQEQMLLIDTRSKPWSKIPEYRQEALKERYKARYRFAGQYLGNVNFNNGEAIKIANPVVGITGLMKYLSKGYDLIILCGCAQFELCHRKVIIDLLKGVMPDVEVVMPDNVNIDNSINCLSVRQPYASWLVNPKNFINAQITPKCIENRDWTTSYRGPLLIHASKTFEDGAIEHWLRRCPRLGNAVSLEKQDYPLGYIIGIVDFVNIVEDSDDPWFCGQYGWVFANAMPFDALVHYRGSLRLFDVPVCHCCSMPINDGNSEIVGDEHSSYRLCADCVK